MPKVFADTAKVFYEESKAASDALDDVLKQYRSNTTTVLALATGAAAFFGFEDSAKGGWFIAALVAYGAAAILAAQIFWPTDWKMNPAVDFRDRLVEEPPLSLTKAHFDLAVSHQQRFEANREAVGKLQSWYRWLVLATALVVVLAGVNTILNQPEVSDEPTKIQIVEEPE